MHARTPALALTLFLATTPLASQQARSPAAPVTYQVSFPNAVHHEAEITLTVSGLVRGRPAELWMSRSSPGRYALHEFAKNVYRVRVTDGKGRTLTPSRPNPYSWLVPGHDGTVKVSYTLYGNLGDGTYAQVDLTHAHLNMPATFMWVRGLDTRPIRVTFEPPAGSSWKIATQLFPTPEPFTFTAPGLQYFMDSPTELSNYTLREWTVTVGGKTWPIRLALHHTGTDAEADSFAGLAKRVVEAHMAVYGEAPKYDVGYYTFLADYIPWGAGDGMEHRNSTVIASTGSLAKNMSGLLSTLSHEFFHSWNVERIRPKGLEPFDFTRANMSDGLWFAEGFTNYYGPLAIVRAGITQPEDFAHGWSGPLNIVVNSPARGFFSPAEMSMQAPFVDAATSVDPNNRSNTFISYYTWGSVVGLGLDLTLRTRGHTLDELMRLMWQRHGKTEIAYALADIEKALADLTGDRAFAREFFSRYVTGRDVVDYKALLAQAGFLLRQSRAGQPTFGNVQMEFTPAGIKFNGNTQIGSPWYQAGLDVGDLVTSVDGKLVESDSTWQALRSAHRPGDKVEVEYQSRGQSRTATVTLIEDPRLEVVTYEEAGLEVTPEMREFRAKWLGLPKN